MSLTGATWAKSPESFPRVSGDEPGSERLTYRRTGFSPRERG